MPEPTFDLIVADAVRGMRTLSDESVHAICTSPPYWSLRDYETPPQVWADGWTGELGQEPTPDMYAAHVVEVFEEVKRVLRRDGVAFVNVDDTYLANRPYQVPDSKWGEVGNSRPMRVPDGLKPKELALVPQRLAIALQQAGWWVRCDLVWDKPDAMPESMSDRPTRSHEYLWMLTKSPSYFYDQEAVRPPANGDGPSGPNLRSVWRITTDNNSLAHYATMSKKVAETAIKAATSERGCCAKCGAPVERVVERTVLERPDLDPGDSRYRPRRYEGTKREAVRVDSGMRYTKRRTLGWRATCAHDLDAVGRAPCVVLDPFLGSGTTAVVARRLGRSSIGIELSEESAGIAREWMETWWRDPPVQRLSENEGQLQIEVV